MAGLQIVQERGNIQSLVVLVVRLTIDGKVHHSQKSISIDTVHLTNLRHGLVTKTQIDTKRTQCLQDAVVILDKGNHLVLRLIHLQIFHLAYLIYIIIAAAKVIIFDEKCNI